MEKDKDLGAVTYNIEFVDNIEMPDDLKFVSCGRIRHPQLTAEQEEGIRKHAAAQKKIIDEVKKEWEEKQKRKFQPKPKKS